MKLTTPEINRFALLGMAALTPGMQYMTELMQRAMDEHRTLLSLCQLESDDHSGDRRIAEAKGSWAHMSAAERSTEMKRRIAMRARNKAPALNPRDRDHPEHAKWVAKMGKLRKAAWAKKSKAERQAWTAAMAAGRAKAGRKSPQVITAA
jgi:hypothetical protein